MDKFLDWLGARFQQPLSLLFFLLGAFLVFFGLSSGLTIPGLGNSTPDPQHRWVALVIGIVCCVLAILLFYLPRSSQAPLREKGESEDVKSFTELLDPEYLVTSQTQRRILNVFAILPDGGLISQNEITQKIQAKIENLKNASWSEIYYRLEQLRWMGFLTKRKIGPEFMYGLSARYRRFLADS